MTVLKADQQAADRLLKAAVRRAREWVRDTSPDDVVAMLTAAGESAALLLDERPAKKAAARKGASS